MYRRYALEHNLRTPEEDHDHLVQKRHNIIRKERDDQRLYKKTDTEKLTVLVLVLDTHCQNAGDHAERLRHDADVLLFHIGDAAEDDQREVVPLAQFLADRVVYVPASDSSHCDTRGSSNMPVHRAPFPGPPDSSG